MFFHGRHQACGSLPLKNFCNTRHYNIAYSVKIWQCLFMMFSSRVSMLIFMGVRVCCVESLNRERIFLIIIYLHLGFQYVNPLTTDFITSTRAVFARPQTPQLIQREERSKRLAVYTNENWMCGDVLVSSLFMVLRFLKWNLPTPTNVRNVLWTT